LDTALNSKPVGLRTRSRREQFRTRAELKAWGIELVFRGSEFTVRREADGSVTCHPHANVVFNFSRKLAPEQFREFLRFAKRRLGLSLLPSRRHGRTRWF
jgi:hypothetical protein